MNLLQAVIFDLDGVIADSEPWHERAFREVFAELGFQDESAIRFSDYFGRSDRAVWQDFVARYRTEETVEELLQRKQRHFIRFIRRERPVYYGVPGLVERLAGGFRLAIASGSQHLVIEEILALANVRRFFPVTVSAEDVPQGKPAPDVFLQAADQLGVEPGACCVIEDSPAGIEGALAAGMRVVAITNSLPREKLVRATRVVSDYSEIEPFIEEWNRFPSDQPRTIPRLQGEYPKNT